jgi:hypothetical protein
MSNVAKFLIVVNLLLAGVFVGSAANFLGQKDFVQQKQEGEINELKAKFATVSQERAALDTKNKELSGENNNLKAEILVARQSATDAKKESEGLSTLLASQGASLSRAVMALELLNSQTAALQTLNATLQAERASMKESRDIEHTARVAAEALVATTGRQLEDEVGARKSAEGVVADTNRKVQQVEAELEAYRTQFPNFKGGTAQPAISPGKVLAADNAMGLVVISLGEEDGLKRGYEYIVSRGSQYVATIKITDVQAKKATGTVVKGMQKSPVQANDTVMNP